jgi:hypothetical protein
MISFFTSSFITFSALSVNAVRSFFKVSIFFSKFVTIIAMSFSSIYCWYSLASENVNLLSNKLKMFRVYTKSIFTKMIENLTFRYSTFQKFVRNSMRSTCPFAGMKKTVALVSCTRPYPTFFSFINFTPKAFHLTRSNSHAGWCQ